MRAAVIAVLLVLGLTGCTDTLVSGPDECPDNAACAPPRGSGQPTLTPVSAPTGDSTIALPTEIIAADGPAQALTVRVEYADLCQDLLGVHVQETAEAITVTGVGTPQRSPCALRAAIVTDTVPLDAPVGDRQVTVVRSKW
jgi:hypothetical protein